MDRPLIDEETIVLSGLTGAGEIRIDRWGIPHIKAGNEADLFFLQGFNAARDRLWQIDLWRKRGLGLLAADFGPGYLAQDFAARHFLYRGSMDAEWISYAPDAQAICTSFAAGINAYVDLVGREPERLPPEFSFFRTQPAHWAPEDVVRIRTHALTRNATSEILRANIMALADAETDLARTRIEPEAPLELAPGIDLADIPLAALGLFKLATARVTFEKERLAATMDEAWNWTEVTDLGDIVRAVAEEGSNNWVVHGSRTATGRPLLASDPHRAHAVPSLRYLVHLDAPGFNAIGTGEPSAPGISLGHNGSTAFGLTIFGADQEDVYVYETNPEHPDFYRFEGGWELIDRIPEVFTVKGAGDQSLDLRFTRHGPVLHTDRERNAAVALRSVWLGPGSAAYLGSLKAMRSKTVHEFRSSLESWGTPSVNHVCADTEGNIGWFTAGFTPVRRNWHGLLPVRGDGTHEWQGYLAAGLLPHSLNPVSGFVATANEMNLTPDRPDDAPSIGHEWAETSRATRIKSVLADDPAHSVEAAQALQTDVFSRPAERIVAVLANLLDRRPVDADLADHAKALAAWNFHLDAESGEAALFEVWWMLHLRPALLALVAPDPKVRALLLPGDVETLLGLIEKPHPLLGDDPEAARDRLLLVTLRDAVADCRKRLGENPGEWAWGKLHKAVFEHATSRVKAEGEDRWDVGPLSIGGSRSTPMHAAYRPSDFRLTSGASVRLVMDVGAWDNSVCINAPGQSGDPRSPHYSGLAEAWSKGRYVPLVYSDSRIAEETIHRIRLLPA